ncbi:MAG: DNA polymerase III subunit beta, partial [Planctomycetales bacterium]
MKITCDRDKLNAAFQTVAPVAPSRTTREILRNVKLEATDGAGMLLATDSEIAVRAEIESIQVEEPGSALLPADRFGPILRESSDDEISLETH